jgi:ABC-type multidrug transport system fused ATPase/permease subunit
MPSLMPFVKISFSYLTPLEKKKIYLIIVSLIFLSFLDLAGVILLGTVATLTFNLVTADSAPTRFELLFQDFFPETISREALLSVIFGIAVVLLLTKTVAQAAFSFKLGKFLAGIESRLSKQLFRQMLHSDVNTLSNSKFSEYHYALMTGSNRYSNGVIGSTVYLISDAATTLLMGLIAVLASPIASISSILIFTLSYFIFNGPINKLAVKYGEQTRETYLKTTESLMESLNGIREIKVYKKENIFIEGFNLSKDQQSSLNQKVLWLNGLIRYILEIAILVSGVVAAVVLVLTTDLKHAITVVTVLLVIGFRLIPNIQRLQNSLNSLRLSRASTEELISLINKLNNPLPVMSSGQGALISIEVKDLCYSYGEISVLRNINFNLPAGSLLVIIGESGSGKSTLIDIISGLVKPLSGKLVFKVKSENRFRSIDNFPLSYITQSSSLFGSDLYENIAFEKSIQKDKKLRIDDILKFLQLEKLSLRNFSNDDQNMIRSDNSNLSGGERQRISVARAIYFDNDIVLMDEPTSALDEENTKRIFDFILKLKNDKTVIISTHSLELLSIADFVLEIKHGEQIYFGAITDYAARNI